MQTDVVPLLLAYAVLNSACCCLQVPDHTHPEYFQKMDRLVELNSKLIAVNQSNAPALLKKLQAVPIIERMVAGVFQLFIMKPLEAGSVDVDNSVLAY
jgi:magnesium-protoporphyrin IX monomethyl ester (oxidative) cyclase